MSLGDEHIVSEPGGDLEDVASVDGEYAGKAVAHDVGCKPGVSGGSGVAAEGSGERVAVGADAGALGGGGFEDVGTGWLVRFEKGFESFCEGNGAVFSTFGAKCLVLGDVYGVSFEVKPFGSGFRNFVEPHAGVKAAIKNEAEIVVGRVGDDGVALLGCAKQQTGCFVVKGEGDGGRGVAGDDVFLHGPLEECAQDHHVGLGGRLGDAGDEGVVVALKDVCGDFVGLGPAGGFAKTEKGVAVCGGGEAGVAGGFELVGDEGFDVGSESFGGIDGGGVGDVGSAGNGLGVVGCFEGNESAAAPALASEPPCLAAKIDAADFSGFRCHSLLSHLTVRHGVIWGYIGDAIKRFVGDWRNAEGFAILHVLRRLEGLRESGKAGSLRGVAERPRHLLCLGQFVGQWKRGVLMSRDAV